MDIDHRSRDNPRSIAMRTPLHLQGGPDAAISVTAILGMSLGTGVREVRDRRRRGW
jgi:hypothetical protein